MRHLFETSGCRRRSDGFSMAEVVMTTAVVGVMLVAALESVAVAKRSEVRTGAVERGALLAQAMLSEVLSCAYAEPGSVGSAVARESGEAGRATFDDVDDYHDWSESPPQNLDGTPMTGWERWGRRVTVEWVHADDLTGPAASAETGAKRVTVSVTLDGVPTATATAVRSDVDVE